MYFHDLELCYYHNGPHGADTWSVPLLAVGWLEHPHPFVCGRTGDWLPAKLESMISAAWEHYSLFTFRGLHECTICAHDGVKGSWKNRSCENLFVPGDRVVYLAPAMIAHYIGDHQYMPPDAFIAAVMNCPDYGSPAYCAALREANTDVHPPLKTQAEWKEEQALFLERLRMRKRAEQPDEDRTEGNS